MKNRICLAMNNISDILALHFFLTEDNLGLQGEFAKEIEYPWQLWWILPKKITQKKASWPWQHGIPKGKLKKTTYIEVLQKLVLEEDKTKKIGHNIVVKTKDEKIFTHLIASHFRLQQGDIYYTSPSKTIPFYFVKIYSPSLWCLHMCKEIGELDVYSNYKGVDSLFVATGWKIREDIHSKVTIPKDKIILLKNHEEIKIYSTVWKAANEIVAIEPTKTKLIKGNENERIKVPLALVATDTSQPCLWKVKDRNKLISILSNSHHSSLAGFKAWLDEEDVIFVFAEGEMVDSILKNQLTEMFCGYVKKQSNVFFPVGKTMMPDVPEKMLLKAHGCNQDFLCFDEDKNKKMHSWTIRIKEAHRLSFFIQYAVQKTLRKVLSFEDQWVLHFDKIIKNPIVVTKSGKENQNQKLKIESKRPKNAIFEVKARNSYPEIDTDIILKLRQLDRTLVNEIGRADLWEKRAEFSRKLGNNLCALIAEMTSCIILQNHSKLLSLIEKNLNESYLNIPQLLDKKNSSSALAQIRNSEIFSAELNYILQLVFSHKYNDQDVLKNAISCMRMGYAGTKYQFHILRDFDKTVEQSSPAIQVQKSEKNEILQKIEKFLQCIDSKKVDQQATIVKQFNLIIENTSGQKVLGEAKFDMNKFAPEWKSAYQFLENYKESDIPTLKDHVKIWLEKISVKNINDDNLDNIFTGDLYRPIFDPEFKKRVTKEIDIIYKNYIDGNTHWQNLFAKGTTHLDNAKKQRQLLYLVTKYGPLADFETFIYDFQFGNVGLPLTIMNCDIYRLSLKYNKTIDEEIFFREMLNTLPSSEAEHCSVDFCDGMENVIMCLFLSSYNKRHEVFLEIFQKILEWINNKDLIKECLMDFLALIALVQMGVLNQKLPNSVYTYNFYARKKSLWMNHANYLAQNGMNIK